MTTLHVNRVYPPLHSVALMVGCLVIIMILLPKMWQSLESVATIETLSTPIFYKYIDTATLGWLRFIISIYMFRVSLARIMSKRQPLEVNYLKQSKLKSLPINVSGFRSLFMFTCLAWNLLAISFGLNGLIVLLIHYQYVKSIYSWILRLAVILFEIAAPTSMLVSAVVTYVLWPKALRGKGTHILKTWDTLVQHNANIILSLVEIGLLGGLPIQFRDCIFVVLFGICYILFSWFMIHRLLPSGEPQAIYFFLDPTLGWLSTFSLVCLLVVLLSCFILFAFIDDVMVHLGGGILIHSLVIAIVSSIVCRFKD